MPDQALAVLEERQGNVAAARALLEAAVKQDPSHVQSWQARVLRIGLKTPMQPSPALWGLLHDATSA